MNLGITKRGRRKNRTEQLEAAVIEALEERQLLSASFNMTIVNLPSRASDVILADVNGDGYPDLITAHANGTVSIQTNNQNGVFQAANSATILNDGLSSNSPAEVRVADFNGHPDLVLQDKTSVSVLLGNGTGIANSAAVFTLPSAGTPRSLAVGDFNGDGYADLAVGDQRGDVDLFPGNGDGTFAAPIVTVTGGTQDVTELVAANFNGDANLDLAAGNKDGSVKLLLGNGNGTFKVPGSNLLSISPTVSFVMVAGQFSSANNDEGLVIGETTGSTVVLLGNGNGTFKAPVTTSLGANVAGFLAVGDFNGDGTDDVALTSYYGDHLFLFQSNGNGSFKSAQTINTGDGSGPFTTDSADINRDGQSDIVVSADGAGQTSALVFTNSSAPGFVGGTTSTTFTSGVGGTFNIQTTGASGTMISSSGTLPSGVSFVNANNGTAKFVGTPSLTTGGTFHVTLTAKSSASSANAAVEDFTITVDQAPKFTSANKTTFATGSPKTFTITTTGTPAATLSENGALPDGLTFTDNGNGTATIAGQADIDQGAQYVLTLNAANSVSGGAGVNQVFTLTVNQPAAITSADTFTFTAGAADTFAITTTGFPAATITESGTLPSGVAFVKNKLIGTPSLTSSGIYNIKLVAANGLAPTATQLFTLEVNGAPAITSANHVTFLAGNTGSFQMTATSTPLLSTLEGLGLEPFNEATTVANPVILPGTVFLDPNTGVLNGTPTATSGGTYVVTLSVNNTVATKSQIFTLQVDQAPLITTASIPTLTAGTAATVAITTTGFPAPTVSEVGALPAGMTFNAKTDKLAGTPSATSGGTYQVFFTASNETGIKTEAAFLITVISPPKIVSDNHFTFGLNNPGAFNVMATGLPAATFSVSGGTLPSGILLTGSVLSGTPTQAGTFVVTLSANNAAGTTTQKFTLLVAEN